MVYEHLWWILCRGGEVCAEGYKNAQILIFHSRCLTLLRAGSENVTTAHTIETTFHLEQRLHTPSHH